MRDSNKVTEAYKCIITAIHYRAAAYPKSVDPNDEIHRLKINHPGDVEFILAAEREVKTASVEARRVS